MNYSVTYPISRFRFCYVDTEYIRPDYTTPPLDKCDPVQVELYSIQYADFFLRRLNVGNLPELRVIIRQPGEDEYIILKKFLPIWERFFKGLLDKKRLIPLGFVVIMDLQLLAKKYHHHKSQFLSEYPDLRERIFSISYLLQNSRFLDVQWPFQLLQGYTDISLGELTNNQSLNNKNTKDVISNLLAPTTDQQTMEILQQQFMRYVVDEYQACMTHVKRRLLSKLPGVYKVDPYPRAHHAN